VKGIVLVESLKHLDLMRDLWAVLNAIKQLLFEKLLGAGGGVDQIDHLDPLVPERLEVIARKPDGIELPDVILKLGPVHRLKVLQEEMNDLPTGNDLPQAKGMSLPKAEVLHECPALCLSRFDHPHHGGSQFVVECVRRLFNTKLSVSGTPVPALHDPLEHSLRVGGVGSPDKVSLWFSK
jgi:hypothetical protein